jgi:translation initiation factor 1 (eIF-1/SUI1)
VALFDFLSPLLTRLKAALGPLGKLWDKVVEAYNHVTNIISTGNHLVDSIIGEVNAWKNFKENIRFKQRVINIEKAVTKTTELIQGIPNSWHAIQDLVKELRSKFTAAETPNAGEVEELETELESGSVTNLLKRFPALAKFFEKALGFVSLIVDSLESIANAIDDLQTIVDECKRIRLEIEELDSIFLQQHNKRQTIKLANGKSIKVRIGSLHTAEF